MQFKVKFPFDEIKRKLRLTQEKIEEKQRNLLEAVGVDLLSKAQQDYRTKSRGGTGTDDIQWNKLEPSTIISRLRKDKKGRAHLAKVAKIKRKVRGGRKLTANEKKYLSTPVEDIGGGKTKSGKQRPGLGQVAIGIDSGLQINSAAPGYKGPDGRGGNIFIVTKTDVTVGYGREYSGHFDDVRPLLPTVLPEAWRKSIGGIVVRGVERIFREGLK